MGDYTNVHTLCVFAQKKIKLPLDGSQVLPQNHVTHMNESCPTYDRVMSHVWISHGTRMDQSCHTYE